MKSTMVNLSNYLRENISSSIDNDLLEKSGKDDLSAVKLDESTNTSVNKLKSILSSTDDVYDEEKRESSWGVWYRSVQKYIEDVANELGKEIGVPFKKNFYGDIEARLGEYSSKDGGSRVAVILDFDSGLQTFVDHSMVQSVKRTRKGGMVIRINYPGQGGSCKTIVLTGADDTKLKNIINALKDINKVKIKDLEKVQGYDSEQKTYKLLVKTLKKYNIY